MGILYYKIIKSMLSMSLLKIIRLMLSMHLKYKAHSKHTLKISMSMLSTLQMKGWWESNISSNLCIPRNESVQPHYFQEIIIMFCLLNPTVHLCICERFMYSQAWPGYFGAAKYVDMDRSWDYIYCSQAHECKNWDWGRAIPFLGIQKWDFRGSVCTQKH